MRALQFNVISLLAPCVVLACANAKGIQEEAAPSPEKGAPLVVEGPEWTRVAPRLLRVPDMEAPDDPALRRTYGPGDMKLVECTKRLGNGTIAGVHCPSGIVVFGPYVATPRNVDVKVSFELHALEKLEFSSDVVSNAKQILGMFEAQMLTPGQSRKLAYRIHVSEAVKALEARVWVSSDKPTAFEIEKLTVAVE